MSDELYIQRNYALVFAQRTRENLEHVHVVTQLANSLLGLIVFLWEKNFVEHIEELQLDAILECPDES